MAWAIVTEILAGALTGGGCSKLGETRLSNGMFSIYFDPGRFAGDEYFQREVSGLVEWIKSSRPAAPGGEILIPGEFEERTRTARGQGIELDDNTWSQIVETGESVGLPAGRSPNLCREDAAADVLDRSDQNR